MIDRRLHHVQGLYVAEFPKRVKIGVSTSSLRARLRKHVGDGALRVAAYPTYTPPRVRVAWSAEITQVERYALDLADRAGRRIGASESFTGLTFEQACECVQAALTARRGGPVYEHPVSFAELGEVLPHVSVLMKQRAAARRAAA